MVKPTPPIDNSSEHPQTIAKSSACRFPTCTPSNVTLSSASNWTNTFEPSCVRALSTSFRVPSSNALNPKALIFCSVLLPQFVEPAQDVASQFATLGLILVVIGLGFDLVYSLIGKEIAAFTASHKGMQKMQNRVVAGLLALIGLKVGLA